jgi:DNA-binding CsgD family transcriptional regulator
VEAIEALRLLSSAIAALPISGLAAEHNAPVDHVAGTSALVNDLTPVASATWDAALVQTRLADLLSVANSAAPDSTSTTANDPADLLSGLSQLDKYLNRAWFRAGVPVQMHEDCTQAVYTTLLQQVGRHRFDALVTDVGHSGIKSVFGRETNEGLSFFRAVDMVKKRAQRERVYQPIDAMDVPASSGTSETKAWRDALREAIDHKLSPREASLINDTLMGLTPAEIAGHWGVAPKTISNEKARLLQKLRDMLQEQGSN